MQRCIIVLFLFLTTCPSYSQESLSQFSEMSKIQSMVKKPTLTSLPDAPVLEHAVDEKNYILGPGDVLTIIIGNQEENTHQVRIYPEGNIVLPSVGSVKVSGLSLFDAKEQIVEKIKSKYRSDEIYVYLTTLRAFRVTVSGAVNKPGLVTVNAMWRVSEAIELCGGFTLPVTVTSTKEETRVETPYQKQVATQSVDTKQDIEFQTLQASKRNIYINRRSGIKVNADIEKYELTGDLDANPYLLDGDVIVVPIKQSRSGQVWILGAVKSPSKFEFVNGDCVKDLLDMAHGFTSDADSGRIELVRFRNGHNLINKSVLELDWHDSTQVEKVLNTTLKADDRLFIRYLSKFHEKKNVEIRGEVVYPGEYALENDKDVHLSELIKRAGGFTDEASLKNAYVVRRAQEDARDPEFERLEAMAVAEMTEMEREYFKVKSRERAGGMGIDFIALFENNDKSHDVILKDDDLIVVPGKELTVKVAGQVINPGLFPYKDQAPLKYYIEESGGYNWNARKSHIRVIKGKTGEWMKPGQNTVIEVGDTIFVPEKPERDWWVMLRETISVVAQLATIYLVIERATSD